MRQAPASLKVTVRPAIEHTDLEDPSIANVTGSPDGPPVAATR
jgi:hypothetical protein